MRASGGTPQQMHRHHLSRIKNISQTYCKVRLIFLTDLFSMYPLYLGSSKREEGKKRGMQTEGFCD